MHPIPREKRPIVRWRSSENIAMPAASVDVAESEDGNTISVRARVDIREDLWGWAVLDVTCPQNFGVGIYETGIVQRTANSSGWIGSASPLRLAYTVSREDGSVAVAPEGNALGVCHWDRASSSFAVSLVAAGTPAVRERWVGGVFDPSTALRPQRLAAGTSLEVRVELSLSVASVPAIRESAVEIPDRRLAEAHTLAVWGSQAPSLGTLELRGSAYPTINLPDRAYGPLHTFFDPDAWSLGAALSYSGDSFLHAQARTVVDRAIDAIRDDGLVPHHFAHDDAEYIAISGSPQPGPNLFLIEAVVDSACADGDIDWLRGTWTRGLHAACEWVLSRLDDERDLLCVEGALWIDVFRRAGFTLDTNAMAVRTLVRAAEIARAVQDRALAGRLDDAAHRIRSALGGLWSDDGDHFVTSRSADWNTVEDHIDAENYLAIATGAASDAQARAIFHRLDTAPEMHPGGRGTLVSLRRYENEDCYLGNDGDSDVTMARLWWADLMARHRVGDRDGFMRYFDPVVSDLLGHVWMRERYDTDGRQVRAHGYHEYPDLFDVLLREAYYGLTLTVETAVVAPLVLGAFRVRFGDVQLDYSQDRVVLEAPSLAPRTVTVRGLHPSCAYRVGGGALMTDPTGVLTASGVTSRFEATRE